MRAVVSIVKPDTILRWHSKLVQAKWDYSKRRKQGPGRPRKPGEVEELVCRPAREDAWGYRRISGELAKQGIAISKSCVADILRRHGLPPSPERKGLTWREFLRWHADVLLCADLFTREVWTFCGLRRTFVLVVMNVRSRTILLAEATFSPHAAWMAQQVRNVLMTCDDLGIRPRYLLHDRDKCFCSDFDTVLQHAGVEPLKTPYHAPNANPYIERWGRSLRRECLNHLTLFGLKSLQRVVALYRRHFNHCRPHQGLANRVPQAVRTGEPGPEPVSGPIGKVHREESLGGLLKSHRRAA